MNWTHIFRKCEQQMQWFQNKILKMLPEKTGFIVLNFQRETCKFASVKESCTTWYLQLGQFERFLHFQSVQQIFRSDSQSFGRFCIGERSKILDTRGTPERQRLSPLID